MTITENPSINLEDLPDDEFRKLVDKELRKDHPLTPADEQVELNALSPRFRDPEVVDRWIAVLEVMKQSSETQLGAKRSDLKKTYGTIPEAEYQQRLRQYHAWKAGNVRFLHSVQARLFEARALRTRRNGNAVRILKNAIEMHRSAVLIDNEPTDADTTLWDILHKDSTF